MTTSEQVVQGWLDDEKNVNSWRHEMLEAEGWERGQQSTVTAWGIEFEKVILADGRHIVVEHEVFEVAAE